MGKWGNEEMRAKERRVEERPRRCGRIKMQKAERLPLLPLRSGFGKLDGGGAIILYISSSYYNLNIASG